MDLAPTPAGEWLRRAGSHGKRVGRGRAGCLEEPESLLVASRTCNNGHPHPRKGPWTGKLDSPRPGGTLSGTEGAHCRVRAGCCIRISNTIKFASPTLDGVQTRNSDAFARGTADNSGCGRASKLAYVDGSRLRHCLVKHQIVNRRGGKLVDRLCCGSKRPLITAVPGKSSTVEAIGPVVHRGCPRDALKSQRHGFCWVPGSASDLLDKKRRAIGRGYLGRCRVTAE